MSARRPWAWSLVPLYAAGLAVKDGLRAAGLLRTHRLAWPVVSVGSLSAGGAGKTPVVIALARLLRERGWDVDVLSRGYGRQGRDVEQVDFMRENAARRFGDEPVEIARSAGVPVWVGADRFAAGLAAESNGMRSHGVHLLDDGFQHRRLMRAADVVLVTAEDLDDALLPAGNRREPLRVLRRADAVIVRAEELEQIGPAVRRYLRREVPMWAIERRLDAQTLPPAGSRPLAFCAIARPANFWRMLEESGCTLAGRVPFDDHHGYGRADMERLMDEARQCGATGFVTTEKDAVKLSANMQQQLESLGPLCIAKLRIKFADSGVVAQELEALLR